MESLRSSSEIDTSIEMSDALHSNNNASATLGSSSSFNENVILDEMDAYWDDLSSGLTVSRIVTDSVIKGIVNAVTEEAAEQIALKDAEIASLNRKLQKFEATEVQGNDLCQSVTRSEAPVRCSADGSFICKYGKQLGVLKTELQDDLQRLQKEIKNNTHTNLAEKFNVIDGLVDALEGMIPLSNGETCCICCPSGAEITEQQWQLELEKEITSILFKNFVEDMSNKLQTTIYHPKNFALALAESWDKRFDELQSLRQQLDAISKSALNSEWGFLVSQHNFEGLEDWSKHKVKEQSSRQVSGKENGAIAAEKSKDSAKEGSGDTVLLKHMEREDLITYFKKEMNEMKRQHDMVLQEKTEEIFTLKRELLKEKGSNPSHFRNNKEFELMRKKISELILKLDEILLENKYLKVRGKADALPGQQDNVDALDVENQQLQVQKADKEADYVKQIKKLESDIVDAQAEAITRDEIERMVLKEVISELQIDLQGLEMESKIKQDICSIICDKALADAMSSINSRVLKYCEERSSAKVTSLQIEEIKNLKRVVDSFNAIVKEKEEFVSEIEFRPINNQIDHLFHELDLLKEKVCGQDLYIAEKSKDFYLIMGTLEQALQQVHCNEMMLSELNDKFRKVSYSLEEVEKQKNFLCGVIEEKEKALAVASGKEVDHRKCMKSVAISVADFAKFVVDYQGKIASKLEYSKSRLGSLNGQCNQLMKQANFLRKKALRYKEILEIRGSNLQKAEHEVDLLGDEVEALSKLLGKIYIALDHYSPVLQHYTGVMEILKMIKREIGE